MAALITTGILFIAGPPASAATVFADDFDRPDSTDLGPSWTELAGDLTIGNNVLVNPALTSGLVRAVGVTANRSEADVAAATGVGIQYAGLVLGMTSNPSENVFVKVQDGNLDGAFDAVYAYYGNNSGVAFDHPVDYVTPFSTGHLVLTRVGVAVHLTIDTGGDATPEDDLSWTMPAGLNLGDGVGVGAYGGASVDSFVASSPAQTVSFTSVPDSPAEVGGSATVAAEASTGLPVAITSATPTICSVSQDTIHYLSTGICRVRADQAGDGFYEPTFATQSITVEKAKPEVVAAFTPTTAYFGQTITATALLTFPGAYQAGTVQFALDGVPTGSPVPTTDAPLNGGPPRADLQLPATPHAGTHTLGATYTPDSPATTDSASGSRELTVLRQPTVTEVAITAGVATATVTPFLTGAAPVPTGNVAFTVNGFLTDVVALSSGQAALPTAVQRGDAVSAIYAGSADFLTSADSTAESEPTITATVHGQRSASGWYSGPVTVSFTCTQHFAQLTAPCPGPVAITDEGAQTVTRTIHDVEGGVATTSVQLNVDRTGPVVRVSGLDSKAPYLGDPSAGARCAATDPLSGVESCTISGSPAGRGRFDVDAVAADRAGNTSTTSITVATSKVVVTGAKYRKGRWQLGRGSSVTLFALSKTRPVLLGFDGSARLEFFPAGRLDGDKRWALGLTVPSSAATGTTKLEVRTRGATYLLPVVVRR